MYEPSTEYEQLKKVHAELMDLKQKYNKLAEAYKRLKDDCDRLKDQLYHG